MIKRLFFNFFSFLLILFIFSCAKYPSFTRESSAADIERLCQKEFAIDVHAWYQEDTLWVYAALNHLDGSGSWKTTTEGLWTADLEEKIQNITYVLHKVIFSLDRPPKFYCLVNSNIESQGMDQYNLALVEKEMMQIMEKELLDDIASKTVASVRFRIDSPSAIGDRTGSHIYSYDVCLNEFIAMVIMQKIENLANTNISQQDPIIKNIDIDYQGTNFYINLDLGSNIAYLENRKFINLIKQACEQIFKDYEYIIPGISLRISESASRESIIIKSHGEKYHPPSPSCDYEKNSYSILNIKKANFYYKIARRYFQDNNYALAQEYLDESLKVLNSFPASLKLLDIVNDYLSTNSGQDIEETDIYLKQARDFMNQDNYQEAVSILEMTAKLDPNIPQTYIQLGIAYSKTGQYSQSLEAFDTAIRLDPANQLAYYNQGWTYNEIREYEKAEKSFQKAVKINPALANAYHGLAISQLKQKKYQEASENLQSALQLYSNQGDKKSAETVEYLLKSLP
ncbi:MAG: tetratricopeptide repeat protein [Candidatus Omnitrophica bacterium]|nr:tetratricopeptide repeat protein [Candidatus Omnitrophota bacterium]